MTSGFIEAQAFQMLVILLPNFPQEKLKKLAEDECRIIKKICRTYNYYRIPVGDMLNVIYFAAKEAVEKFKPEFKVPIEGYIKYITALRAKDDIRKWVRGTEAKKFVENTSIHDKEYTTYEHTINVQSLREETTNYINESVKMMLMQYCEKTDDKKIRKCVMMIYEQYTAHEIQKILKISRREFERIRKDFFEYARNYWNYDNIY